MTQQPQYKDINLAQLNGDYPTDQRSLTPILK